jgi:hypothetical protein
MTVLHGSGPVAVVLSAHRQHVETSKQEQAI